MPFVVFVVSRLLLAIMASTAPHLLPTLRKNPTSLPHTDPLAAVWSWSSPWFRFDARWYVSVVQHGYHWGAVSQTNTNFFPLYPILIRAVQPLALGSPWLASLLVANLAFLGALVLLWRWALNHWEREMALRVILVFACFPFAFFYVTPYAEPVFVALAIAAFLFAEDGRWTLAIIAAGLATITRPVGVAVVVGVMAMALRDRGVKVALLSGLGFLPFVAFWLYLQAAVGHPLGFATYPYHTYGWVPPHGGLLTTLRSQFHTKLSPFDRVDAALALIFLLSVVPVWRRLGAGYAIYLLIGVCLPLERGLAGMERYVIVLFPAMAVWATARKPIALAVFSVSLLLLLMATTMFASGYSLF